MQSSRGPRRPREATLREIKATQKSNGYSANESTSEAVGAGLSSSPISTSHVPTSILIEQLCVYRVRMYPVWPVIKVEESIAALQKNEEDVQAYALATSLAAATMAQLKLAPPCAGAKAFSAEMIESECQRTRTPLRKPKQMNLTTLRTSFFLHIYHENREAGGMVSMLYLREAITMAHMMGLHQEASYVGLAPEEQQLCRRILWLLFITERGVAILHNLPVTMKVNAALPIIDNDEVLPAFLSLVDLFWMFDQSGMFEVIQGLENSAFPYDWRGLRHLQEKLQTSSLGSSLMNDIQKADLCVTRQWMRAILWKIPTKYGLSSSVSKSRNTPGSFPVQLARECLSMISGLPSPAIEAHGFGMELKLYEIASSAAEALVHLTPTTLGKASVHWQSGSQPPDVLASLLGVLSKLRGGNTNLMAQLGGKIMALQGNLTQQPTASGMAQKTLDFVDPRFGDDSAGQASDVERPRQEVNFRPDELLQGDDLMWWPSDNDLLGQSQKPIGPI